MSITYADIDKLLARVETRPAPPLPPEMQGITLLPADSPIYQLDAERLGASFRHFTPEQAQMVTSLLEMSPDAGYWVGESGPVPTFIPKLPFVLNGHPEEINRARIWLT